ncbi:hypothetical protein D3C78_1881120 [compost metagenome]
MDQHRRRTGGDQLGLGQQLLRADIGEQQRLGPDFLAAVLMGRQGQDGSIHGGLADTGSRWSGL